MKIHTVTILQDGSMSTHYKASFENTTKEKAMDRAKEWLFSSEDGRYYQKLYKRMGWKYEFKFDKEYYKSWVCGPFHLHVSVKEID